MFTAMLTIGIATAHPFDKDIVGHQIDLLIDEEVSVTFVVEFPIRLLRAQQEEWGEDADQFLLSRPWAQELELLQNGEPVPWSEQAMTVTQRAQFVDVTYRLQAPLNGQEVVLRNSALLAKDAVFINRIKISDAHRLLATDAVVFQRRWVARFGQWSSDPQARLVRLVLRPRWFADVHRQWRKHIWGETGLTSVPQLKQEQGLKWYWKRSRSTLWMALICPFISWGLRGKRERQLAPLTLGLLVGWGAFWLNWQTALLLIAFAPLAAHAVMRRGGSVLAGLIAGLMRPFWLGILAVILLQCVRKGRCHKWGWTIALVWLALTISVGIWLEILLN